MQGKGIAVEFRERRVAYFDNLKFILIIFVVLGHLTDMLKSISVSMAAVRYWIYLFHVHHSETEEYFFCTWTEDFPGLCFAFLYFLLVQALFGCQEYGNGL